MTANLEYYKVFYYVAKCGSLTLAAKELSVSQPAVSQALKQLEEALNTRLFVRASRGIQLTPEGEVLYACIKKGYEQIKEGERALRGMLDLEFGELRIGASDMTLKFFLLPYLEKYHEKYPHIKVRVTNAPTPDTLHLLKEHKIDFGVVSTPFEMTKEMTVFPVREIQDCFVAGKKFSVHDGQKLKLNELEKMPIISLEKDTSTRRYIDDFLKESKVEMKPEFELATSDMIVQFAVRNLGIGCVMKGFAEECLQRGELFELKFEKEIPKRQICVVTESKVPVSAAARKFLNMINKVS